MKKRIYFTILILLLLCALLVSTSVCLIFYDVTTKREMAAMRESATLMAALINQGTNTNGGGGEEHYDALHAALYKDFISDGQTTARITIIAQDGTVLLDNKLQASALENHKDREEFKQALLAGSGESIRYSTTFGSAMYYYAVKLSDGNVLRISKTIQSIVEIFTAVIPAVVILTLLILLLANGIARRLTNNIMKNINTIDFESDDEPVYDELAPYMGKIRQQKSEISRQLLALENRADTIKAITENMKEGLILIDKNGVILSANISALEIFNETDIVNKNILHISRNMDLLQKMRRCLSGENSEMQYHWHGKIYTIYLNPVYYSGAINGAIILFLDATESYKAEKQRREFSANVSHELKTPLTTISALSEMIGNGMAKQEDITDFAVKISQQAQRLINIIDDIIRLSEFDEGMMRKEFISFDVYALACSVKAALQEEADKKQVHLEVQGVQLFLNANRRMMDELLYNLMDNAIKYNKLGGKVTVTVSAADGFCILSVADTGIGIPKQHLERVFERFYRVDQSRSQRTGGTGLGLSIVKHVAEYHKGRVEIKSMENTGTTITCFIKL